MNRKMLGFRVFQVFSVVVLLYGIYYTLFLEDQLSSSLAANAKFYKRTYGFAMLWMSLTMLYILYRQVYATNREQIAKPNIK